MNKRLFHPRYTQSSVAHLGELPVSPDLDLCEIADMGNGSYHKRDHIEQDSDYVPFEQIEPALDMDSFTLRCQS